jgi:hypothetical protein
MSDYGVAAAEMAVHATRATASTSASAPYEDAIAADLSGRALYGTHVGYGFGIDFALGATSTPAMLYDFTLYPAGVGLPIGATGLFGVFAGAGVDGASARVPFAVVLPLDARLELDAGAHVRLLFDGRIAWAPWTEARADRETSVGIGVRLGRLWEHDDYRSSRGYFLRLERSETMGAAYVGFTFGFGMGFAG